MFNCLKEVPTYVIIRQYRPCGLKYLSFMSAMKVLVLERVYVSFAIMFVAVITADVACSATLGTKFATIPNVWIETLITLNTGETFLH